MNQSTIYPQPTQNPDYESDIEMNENDIYFDRQYLYQIPTEIMPVEPPVHASSVSTRLHECDTFLLQNIRSDFVFFKSAIVYNINMKFKEFKICFVVLFLVQFIEFLLLIIYLTENAKKSKY
jgi:hypothetical protein